MKKQQFDIVELAELLDVRRHIIAAWVNKGCPYIQKADRARRQEWQFDLAEVLRWREQQAKSVSDLGVINITKANPSKEQLGVDEAQRLKALAETEIAELQLAKIKGELIEKDKVKQILLQLAHRDQEAWRRWSAHTAQLIAAELGIDGDRMLYVLDKYVRQHLQELLKNI